jgi:beta-lactamase class A
VEAELRAAIGDLAGRIGVAGRDLRAGQQFLLEPDGSFPTASMVKLPVLVELFRQVEAGQVRLADRHELSASSRNEGSGILKALDAGLQPTIRDLAFLMMSVSDNTATNILIRLVGVDRVNAMLAAEGISGIELRHEIDFDYLWEQPEHLAVGTPRAFADLMERIYRRAIVSPDACERMLAMMAGVGPERIPRYLPFNPYGQELVRRGLAEPREWVQVAGKTGRLLGVAGHVVAVWSQDVELVLAVMTSESPDPGFGVDHPQMLAIARVGKLVYERCLGRPA